MIEPGRAQSEEDSLIVRITELVPGRVQRHAIGLPLITVLPLCWQPNTMSGRNLPPDERMPEETT